MTDESNKKLHRGVYMPADTCCKAVRMDLADIE